MLEEEEVVAFMLHRLQLSVELTAQQEVVSSMPGTFMSQ